jgi:hypothetical protein
MSIIQAPAGKRCRADGHRREEAAMTNEPDDDGRQDSSEGGSDDDKVNDPLTQSDEGEKAPRVEWGQNPAED